MGMHEVVVECYWLMRAWEFVDILYDIPALWFAFDVGFATFVAHCSTARTNHVIAPRFPFNHVPASKHVQ